MLLAFFIYFVANKQKERNVENSDPKILDDITRMSADLQSLHNSLQTLSGNLYELKASLPLLMSNESNKQMSSLQESFKNQNAASGKAMLDFQSLMSKNLTDNIQAMNKKVDDNFKEINDRVNKSIQDGFGKNSDTMGELKEQLGAIGNAQKHLEEIQKDVVSLNNILSGSQTRGAYGELQLEMLLEQTFPNGKGKYYNIQDDLGYTKGSEKTRPDADLVFSVNGEDIKLCIDSKFPFSDYSRLFMDGEISQEDKLSLRNSFKNAVKVKYKDIADKYIIEGITLHYAVMFIPNDGIFAYIQNEFPDLVSEARSLGVIMSCPSTLQAIIVIFHNAAIENERSKNLKMIGDALNGLSKEFDRFSARWNALQRCIQSANKSTIELGTTVDKITNRFQKINKSNFASIEENDDEMNNNEISLQDEDETKNEN
jgi:DNA recombination protein RmuC